MLAIFRSLKGNLQPKNDLLKPLIPEGSAAQRIDIALLDFLISHTNALGRELTTALPHGMPLSGEVPQAVSLSQKEPKTQTKLENVLLDVHPTSEKILRNLRKQTPEDRQLFYEMTLQEIADGKVSSFRPLKKSKKKLENNNAEIHSASK